MTGIQIKIAGEWLELPEDFSISLEQNNPLFNEQGTFSFPFEIPIEPNRHIFKNVADPFGDLPLSAIDKTEAEVWFGGVMLYRGIIEADEEVEFDGVMPVTFLSTFLIPAALLWMVFTALGWNWELLAQLVTLLTSSFCLFIDRLGRIPALSASIPFTPLMLSLLYAFLLSVTWYIKRKGFLPLCLSLAFLLLFSLSLYVYKLFL